MDKYIPSKSEMILITHSLKNLLHTVPDHKRLGEINEDILNPIPITRRL